MSGEIDPDEIFGEVEISEGTVTVTTDRSAITWRTCRYLHKKGYRTQTIMPNGAGVIAIFIPRDDGDTSLDLE